MKSVALILAKEDSARLQGKNAMDFCGKPMFVWNLEKCVKIFDKVYVSSDSDEILNLAEKKGALPIKRPKDLCGNAPNIPVYQHALKYMDNPDFIIAVQANSPTIKDSLIKEAKMMIENHHFQELMTCDKNHKIYGSIWGLSKERLLSYGDPYKPSSEILLLDESTDIHTIDDFNRATDEFKKYNNLTHGTN